MDYLLFQRAELAPFRDKLADGMFLWLAGYSETGTVILAKDCSQSRLASCQMCTWWGSRVL